MNSSTYLRVVETWVTAADGSVLELAGGCFDNAPEFGALSRGTRFEPGQGLPGHAWSEGRPILLSRLETSYFQRTVAARAAGLCCAAALPIFIADRLTSVVLLLCGETESAAGTMELLHNPLQHGFGPEQAGGRADGSVEPAARRHAAAWVEEFGDATHLPRTQTALETGVLRALAIPAVGRNGQAWLLSLVSSGAQPIARRVECWLSDEGGIRLQRGFGFCEARGRLHANALTAVPLGWLGLIAAAWNSGVAQAGSSASATGAFESGEAADCGLTQVLAIPVIVDAAVSEVIALHF